MADFYSATINLFDRFRGRLLPMQVELLEAKTETFGPLGRRRSRR